MYCRNYNARFVYLNYSNFINKFVLQKAGLLSPHFINTDLLNPAG